MNSKFVCPPPCNSVVIAVYVQVSWSINVYNKQVYWFEYKYKLHEIFGAIYKVTCGGGFMSRRCCDSNASLRTGIIQTSYIYNTHIGFSFSNRIGLRQGLQGPLPFNNWVQFHGLMPPRGPPLTPENHSNNFCFFQDHRFLNGFRAAKVCCVDFGSKLSLNECFSSNHSRQWREQNWQWYVFISITKINTFVNSNGIGRKLMQRE